MYPPDAFGTSAFSNRYSKKKNQDFSEEKYPNGCQNKYYNRLPTSDGFSRFLPAEGAALYQEGAGNVVATIPIDPFQ